MFGAPGARGLNAYAVNMAPFFIYFMKVLFSLVSVCRCVE
uniref:Uncharacterized protein n=1 Tax=Anguilla anguilla TaxID=7936 RepID=A0A0E9XJA7_ANGAN